MNDRHTPGDGPQGSAIPQATSGKPRWRRRLIGNLRLGGLSVLVVVVLVVSITQILRSRPLNLPTPPGPFSVGRTFYDWIDSTRRDPFAPNMNRPRELLIWVWYPATPVSHSPRAPYFPPKWAAAIDDNWSQSALTQRLSSVVTNTYENAPIAGSNTLYPVAILLPGLGRAPGEYTTLAESLASQGTVVVGITPTYSTSTVVFPDGHIVKATPAASDEADFTQLVAVWADDVQFVLHQLAVVHDSVTDRLDLRQVGMLGHSLGGATAAEACRREVTCQGAVDLDGTPYEMVVQTGVPHPLLLIVGEQNQDPQWVSEYRDIEALYQHSARTSYLLLVHGMRHDNFLDVSMGFSPILRLAGGVGTIEGQRGLFITTVYVAAFFAATLHGQTSPLLVGPSSAYPEVQFASQ